MSEIKPDTEPAYRYRICNLVILNFTDILSDFGGDNK